MPDVARHFWGEPNRRHSSPKEFRWGTNGARTVDVGKGTWSTTRPEGGGVIDFLKREGVRESAVAQASADSATQRRPPELSVQHRRGLRLHRRIRHAAVPGLPPRAEVLSPAAPGTTGQGGRLGVERQRRGSVPFRLPELIEALTLEHRLFVVEGEKDVREAGAPWHRRNL